MGAFFNKLTLYLRSNNYVKQFYISKPDKVVHEPQYLRVPKAYCCAKYNGSKCITGYAGQIHFIQHNSLAKRPQVQLFGLNKPKFWVKVFNEVSSLIHAAKLVNTNPLAYSPEIYVAKSIPPIKHPIVCDKQFGQKESLLYHP